MATFNFRKLCPTGTITILAKDDSGLTVKLTSNNLPETLDWNARRDAVLSAEDVKMQVKIDKDTPRETIVKDKDLKGADWSAFVAPADGAPVEEEKTKKGKRKVTTTVRVDNVATLTNGNGTHN